MEEMEKENWYEEFIDSTIFLSKLLEGESKYRVPKFAHLEEPFSGKEAGNILGGSEENVNETELFNQFCESLTSFYENYERSPQKERFTFHVHKSMPHQQFSEKHGTEETHSFFSLSNVREALTSYNFIVKAGFEGAPLNIKTKLTHVQELAESDENLDEIIFGQLNNVLCKSRIEIQTERECLTDLRKKQDVFYNKLLKLSSRNEVKPQ